MEEKEILDGICRTLTKKGYHNISITPKINFIEWSFDIFAEGSDNYLAIEFRKNSSIPEVFFEKLKKIKKTEKKLYIYFAFQQHPDSSLINVLKENGIGVILFQNNKIYFMLESKDFSKRSVRKIKKVPSIPKSFPSIFVYVCSKQYETDGRTPCKEREVISSVVGEYNRVYSVPIFVHKIENEFQGDVKFKEKILKYLKKSQFFVGAVNERYSEYIDYEIRNVFRYIDKDFVLIFKKEIKQDEIEKDELNRNMREKKQKLHKKLINFVHKKTDSQPYSKTSELRDQVKKHLMTKIIEFSKKKRVKSPFER